MHQRSIGTPIYVIGEGNEPPFFTCFFDWDPSKTNVPTHIMLLSPIHFCFFWVFSSNYSYSAIDATNFQKLLCRN